MLKIYINFIPCLCVAISKCIALKAMEKSLDITLHLCSSNYKYKIGPKIYDFLEIKKIHFMVVLNLYAETSFENCLFT